LSLLPGRDRRDCGSRARKRTKKVLELLGPRIKWQYVALFIPSKLIDSPERLKNRLLVQPLSAGSPRIKQTGGVDAVTSQSEQVVRIRRPGILFIKMLRDTAYTAQVSKLLLRQVPP
jgi:hypothetical protein